MICRLSIWAGTTWVYYYTKVGTRQHDPKVQIRENLLLISLLESLFNQGYPTDGCLLALLQETLAAAETADGIMLKKIIVRSEAGKEFHLSAARNESE